MRNVSAVVVLLFVAVSFFVAARAQEDSEGEAVMDLDTAHRAKYCIMSQVKFDDREAAELALADIKYGYRTFDQVASNQNDVDAVNRQAGQSGDMGLVEFHEVHPLIASMAFDVRNPIAKSASDIQGPFCDEHCYIFVVFNRYRKDFFSQAWYEAEQFAKETNQKFGELLDSLANEDGARQLAFAIWPDEHVTEKKLKLQYLKNDMDRVGKRDWSAEPENADRATRARRKSTDMSNHNALMEKREQVLAHISPETLKAHPEIYGMAIDQIVEAGFIAEDKVAELNNVLADGQGTPLEGQGEKEAELVPDVDTVEANEEL